MAKKPYLTKGDQVDPVPVGKVQDKSPAREQLAVYKTKTAPLRRVGKAPGYSLARQTAAKYMDEDTMGMKKSPRKLRSGKRVSIKNQ